MATHILLQSEAFGETQVDVLALRGHEAIGELFSFDIELLTSGGMLDDTKVLESPLTLVFRKGDEVIRRIHGIAADLEERMSPSDRQHTGYALRFVPRMWLASVNETLDICMNMTVPEIIAAKLEKWELKLGDDLIHRLRSEYPKREFVVQYRESDVDFVCRLAEHIGISLTFEHDDTRDLVVFSDHNEAFKDFDAPQAVRFVDQGAGDGVSQLHGKTRTLPKRVVLRDYNYRTPGIDLTAVGEVPGGRAGDVVEYGAHFKSKTEGEAFAKVRVQEQLSTRLVFSGESVDPAMRAGRVIKLEGHPRGELELLIVEVDHESRQASALVGRGGDLSYQCRFRAIMKDVYYRPPRRVEKPKVQGMLTGVVDASAKGAYAELDDEGRYKVKFLYDTAGKDDGQASKAVRMAQPHAGAGYGMHFPLRPGIEVMLTCIDGDPDRPIIASTVPNASTPSPVTGGNNARNVIRTGGGNEINIDDTDGAHRIKMSTPHDGTMFQLGSPNFSESGAALATTGAITSVADKGVATATSFSTAVTAACTLRAKGNVVTHVSAIDAALAKAQAAQAFIGAAKSAVGMVTAARKLNETVQKNAMDRAKDKYDKKVKALSVAQKKKYDDYRKKKDEEAALEKEHAAAEARVEALEERLAEVNRELNDELGLGDEEALKREKAKLEKQLQAARKDEKAAEEKLDAAKKVTASAEKELEKAPDAVKNVDAFDTAHKEAADTKKQYTDDKKNRDTGVDKWADATLGAVNAGVGAYTAGKTLVSEVAKFKNMAQQVQGVVEAETTWKFGNALAKRARLGSSSVPPAGLFHVLSCDAATALLGKAATIVGSLKDTTITASSETTVTAPSVVVSSMACEVNGMLGVNLTSNTLIDAFSKKDVRIVAHPSEQKPKKGAPNMLLVAKGNLQQVSTAGSIELFAKKKFELEAETEEIKVTAKAKQIEVKAKTDVKVTAEDADVSVAAGDNVRLDALKGSVVAWGSDRSEISAGSSGATVITQSNGTAFIGTLASFSKGKGASADTAHGIEITSSDMGIASKGGLEVDAKKLTIDCSGPVSIKGKGTATVKGSKIMIG